MTNPTRNNPSLTMITYDPSGGNNPTEFWWFDAIISEEHFISALIMSHPTEEGFDITDHVRELPDEITLTGFVTNHHFGFWPEPNDGATTNLEDVPINPSSFGFVAVGRPPLPTSISARVSSQPELDRVEVVFDKLKRANTQGWLLTIRTAQRTYENMLIDNVRWSPDSGGSGNFEITARHVRIVSTEVREATETERLADQPGRRRGGRSTQQTNQAQRATALGAGANAGLNVGNAPSDIGQTGAG